MTTITDAFLDAISQAEAGISNAPDLRTELIETLWNQWVGCLEDEATEQRQRLREVAADFGLGVR